MLRLIPILKSRTVRTLPLTRHIYQISEEVRFGLSELAPVVALESTIITHGMPFPENVECAIEVEKIVRSQGAIPATICVMNGKVKVGLTMSDLEMLGDTKKCNPVKTSRRDFPYVLSNNLTGGTTVSGTLVACKNLGISVFATGGIGGVHRGANETFDISADLTELGKSNVAVVSSGVKSILDIPKTLEYLETQGVFVATLGPTKDFPAFYSRFSGHYAPYNIENITEAARIIKAHKEMQLDSGLLLAVPVPDKYSIDQNLLEKIIEEALEDADKAKIKGKDTTPFLLSKIANITGGKSLETNMALIKNNAEVAAQISVELSQLIKNSSMKQMSTKSDIPTSEPRPVIIGGCNLDCVAHLDAENIKLDGGMHTGTFNYSAGGVGRNICEALDKLGQSSHFVSAVGDDYQGRLISKKIPNKSSELVKVLPGQNTSQCIVVLDKRGDCSFLLGDMNIHNKITPSMINEHLDIIKKSPLIIMDGNIPEDSMEAILLIASKYNIPVFYEPTDIAVARKAFETKSWKSIKFISPNLNELKHISSYLNVHFKENDGCPLEEASILAKNLANYIDNVIVTLGPQGIIIARRGHATDPFLSNKSYKDVSVRHYPVQKKDKFVNVSGAGDCFAGGFIIGLLNNLPEERCLSLGFAAAITALYSLDPVPNKMFDKSHKSWEETATYATLF